MAFILPKLGRWLGTKFALCIFHLLDFNHFWIRIDVIMRMNLNWCFFPPLFSAFCLFCFVLFSLTEEDTLSIPAVALLFALPFCFSGEYERTHNQPCRIISSDSHFLLQTCSSSQEFDTLAFYSCIFFFEWLQQMDGA